MKPLNKGVRRQSLDDWRVEMGQRYVKEAYPLSEVTGRIIVAVMEENVGWDEV